MKIITGKCCEPTQTLGDCEPGDVVTFNQILHSKHRKDDPFIVNGICSSYDMTNRAYRLENRRGITNLRTGELAFFLKSKKVLKPEAELCLP